MFDPHQKSTGRDYSTTIALLTAALLFVPAVMLASRSLTYFDLSLAGICSVACVTLAWVSWRRHSRLTIPTLEDESPVAK